jgi:hypothetical protein
VDLADDVPVRARWFYQPTVSASLPSAPHCQRYASSGGQQMSVRATSRLRRMLMRAYGKGLAEWLFILRGAESPGRA